MGVHHQDGYSAAVEGFLVVGLDRFRLAKSNGQSFALAEPCDLQPGTEAELLVLIDGNATTRRVILPDGVVHGQVVVKYDAVDKSVPF